MNTRHIIATVLLLALAVAAPLSIDAQTGDAAVVVKVPPHVDDPPALHLLSLDIFKFVGFAHLFYHQGIADHIAVGGALQVPTGLLLGATGVGVQPEITFTLAEDPFDGFFGGISAWANYLHYMPDSTDGRGDPVEVPSVSELVVSIGPVIGLYLEGPINGLMAKMVVGAEYVLQPGTDRAAGLGTDRAGFNPYVSGRLGFRW